ncbi:hypothetical protein [Rhizobium mesoamericanum]|uniref:Uncharacterized protein n=1 Tax=Rhizobium mesoamericanum STM3625 TaxID=1211777 RepID=K0PWY2_9HYPH|nr:hypothetical protein [Rhizobium mesoamericanum]CCM78298.1 hypothetical protein BN77_p10956 [Rhizobium mesoamericanum STM3625]
MSKAIRVAHARSLSSLPPEPAETRLSISCSAARPAISIVSIFSYQQRVELVINSAFYYMREQADTETKQPFINIVRQFIQKVVIGKTPGHQPASLEVHGQIASILAAMEAVTILEKQFEALTRHDYLEKLWAGEPDTEQKQKSSSTHTRRSFL